MDTGEASGDDGETAKMPGLQSGVLSGATLAVVPVTNDDPLDALSLVVTSDSRNGIPAARRRVLDLVGLLVSFVDGTDQHVVRDVVQVSTVLEPGASHGDVVRSRLALGLDQDGHILGILAIPCVERRQNLETVRAGRDLNVHGGAVGRGGLVSILTRVEALAREGITGGRGKLELLAVLVLERVGKGVEVESTSNRQGNDKVRRRYEGVGSRVAVVASGEVTVVRGDDCLNVLEGISFNYWR